MHRPLIISSHMNLNEVVMTEERLTVERRMSGKISIKQLLIICLMNQIAESLYF